MIIELYTSDAVFDTLRPEWNSLLAQSQSNRVFLTWEWLSTWWRAYHPGDLWLLAIRTQDHQLVGLAPWYIEQRSKTGRTIRSIGCVDVTDYLDVVAKIGCEHEVFSSIAAYLAEHRHSFDVLDLCNIPESAPVLHHLPAILRQHNFIVETKTQEVCPVIELPKQWDTYLDSLNKKNRHELRRKLRRLEGDTEQIAWYSVSQEHNLDTETERFLALMRSAGAEKVAFLQDEANVTFFKLMARAIFEAGWLQLAFLTIDGVYAAAYLNFDYNNEILVYNSGLDLNVGATLSPGIGLIAYLIQDAINKGKQRFDFLRGNEEYKYRLGATDTQVLMLIATP